MLRRDALRAAGAALAVAAAWPHDLAFWRSSAEAQAATDALTVASRAQSFYDQTRTVTARFTQHYWQRVQRTTRTSRGRLQIARPGRIRFDYDEPRGMVTVSDGTRWTMYTPGEGSGDAGQFVRADAARDATGALGFLMGTASLRRDFRFTLRTPTASQPAGTDALELRPRRPDPRYTRVILYVDSSASAAGVVRRVSVEDPDGNWNRFDFDDIQFNRTIAPGEFQYQPPAGARELTAPGA